MQYEPLGRALEQYAGAQNRQALLALLVPIQRAAERSTLVEELIDSAGIYHPLKWSPREANATCWSTSSCAAARSRSASTR